MSHEKEKPEALRIKEEAAERERQRLAALNELQKADHGLEKGAGLAPHNDETPAEEHRGGPLPDQKR
ncbi:MAG: hypothetical protein JO322_00440 [Candidatus Eremiobacteraeota bacterium]|nr:hypothetical protein [Candidatus Eremiobacteraeota bacterium]